MPFGVLLKALQKVPVTLLRNTAGKAVSEVGKTAKKTWDGGDNKIGNQKGSDERGFKSSN